MLTRLVYVDKRLKALSSLPWDEGDVAIQFKVRCAQFLHWIDAFARNDELGAL